MEFVGLFGILILILCFILTVIHLVSFFLIKKTDFENVFDTYESSPLFNFEIGPSCGVKSNLIFHIWEGRKKKYRTRRKSRTTVRTEIVDETYIELINGIKFCYNNTYTYRDLLYNDYIIKQNDSCKNGFKNCGIIDTLNQTLCIKEEESCPLYDVKIGKEENSNGYIYDAFSNISYNDINYNGEKKIIGKLILNDGQPCLSLSEKLWKKFSSKEAADGHLKCKFKIDNYENENRFEERGQITYKKLYEDNLNTECKELLLDEIQNEKVSLYKREFLGMDKSCDQKLNLSRNNYDKLKKNQKNSKILVLVEAILLFSLVVIPFFNTLQSNEQWYIFFSLYCLIFFLPMIICYIVFLVNIKNNDLYYDCSDELTNEVLKKQNKNTKKSITIVETNLILDIIAFFLFIILILICSNIFSFFKEKFEYFFHKKNYKNKNNDSKNEIYEFNQNNSNKNHYTEKNPIKNLQNNLEDINQNKENSKEKENNLNENNKKEEN